MERQIGKMTPAEKEEARVVASRLDEFLTRYGFEVEVEEQLLLERAARLLYVASESEPEQDQTEAET